MTIRGLYNVMYTLIFLYCTLNAVFFSAPGPAALFFYSPLLVAVTAMILLREFMDRRWEERA